MSYDGSVILGNERDLGHFVWTAAEGITFVGGAEVNGSYKYISDDGKVVVSNNSASSAYRWTKESGVVELGLLPDGTKTWTTRGISSNGSIIVGNSEFIGVAKKAYIWDEAHGPRYLLDILTNEAGLGGDLTGWTLGVTRGVSGDGRTFMGYGTNPQGNTEAWIASLGAPVPEPSTLILAAMVLAPFIIRNRRRGTVARRRARY